jgi:hypothetical protein
MCVDGIGAVFPRGFLMTTRGYTRDNIGMNSQRAGLRVAGLVFGLVCLGHLWRLIAHADVRIGSHSIPMWLSVFGAIVSAGLSLWMWKLAAKQ